MTPLLSRRLAAIRVSLSVTVDRPVAEVFDFVTDPSTLQSWQRDLVSVTSHPAGPMRAGTVLREVRRRPLGRVAEPLVGVNEVEAGRRIVLRDAGAPLPVRRTETFTADGLRTHIDVVAEGGATGARRALTPFLRLALERRIRGELAQLKLALEQSRALDLAKVESALTGGDGKVLTDPPTFATTLHDERIAA